MLQRQEKIELGGSLPSLALNQKRLASTNSLVLKANRFASSIFVVWLLRPVQAIA